MLQVGVATVEVWLLWMDLYNFYFLLASNGHNECVQTILRHLVNNSQIDCADGQGR